MHITELGREAHEINELNGWKTFNTHSWPDGHTDREAVHFLLAHIALVHSEASEALEAVRKHDRENFDEEMADVIIRVASIAYGLGTDLDSVIAAKLAKNRTRGLHHGGKAV